MTLLHFPLSPRDQLILQTITRFKQATAGQVRRLHFTEGTEQGRERRARRTLARLTKWGLLSRIGRPVGGYGGGSGEHVYLSPQSRTRTPDAHTLDILELYVRLVENGRPLVFDPEQWAYRQVGKQELKPDAFAQVDDVQYFLEIDRGSEWRPQLNQKMQRYTKAFNNWPDDVFPLVVWIVPDEERARLMRGVVKRQEEPALFSVVLFEEATTLLVGACKIPSS